MSEKADPRVEMLHKILDDAAIIVIKHLPQVKEMLEFFVDTVFVPRVIMRQLALLYALEAGAVTVQQLTALIQWLVSNFSSRKRLVRQLLEEQRNAETQDDWMDLAERIDNIQGNDIWRSEPDCDLYERDRIAARIDEYVHLMRRRDIFELMFVLRGSIGRNKFGLLHEGLFTKALAGSKVLTETYHNVVCAALDFVCDAPVSLEDDPVPTDARLAFFNETRHAYGRTALLLSGGAALGFYHVGVVKCLMENRLMPRVIGGSSAGSILSAMIGTRTDEECVRDLFEIKGTDAPGHSGKFLLDFFRPLKKYEDLDYTQRPQYHMSKKVGGLMGGFMEVYYNTAGAFHDAKLTLQGFVPIPMRRASSFLYDLLTGATRPKDIFKNDTAHLRERVRTNVGNFTFQEAFDRTGRILNIVVTPNNRSDPPRLLNYLTAPHVLVWSAAVASSSLPGVFEANRLVIKEADGWERYESGGTQVFSDGSMEQDLPMQQLSEMFNVNHFIISQANPHAVMFASYNQKVTVWTNPITAFLHSILVFLKGQVRSWAINIVQCIGARRFSQVFEAQRGIGMQFFTQEYEGRPCDISLIPWNGHRSLLGALLHIIYNPSFAELREYIKHAERETWSFIPMIKSHIAEEITLDRCVQRLRKRMVQESWEKIQRASSDKIGKPMEGDTMGRVPSFFTSNSLVNLSGLGVSDQPATDDLHEYAQHPMDPVPPQKIVEEVSHNSGWGGKGLKGNRSSGDLKRSSSDASGLFIDDEERLASQQQDAGQNPSMEKKPSSTGMSSKNNSEANFPTAASLSYFKTTSMARFYYRKVAGAADNTTSNNNIQKTTSDSYINRDASANEPRQSETEERTHTRRKSKSHADLMMSSNMFGAGEDN